MRLLKHKFYARGAVEVARDLLGCILVHEPADRLRTAGRIVETEAYLSQADPACHAARGLTPRNRIMFGPPGKAYIYFTYGMHYCFNVVTAAEGVAEAVLIRALEPLEGLEVMRERRGRQELKDLCSGPAKLVQALGLSKTENGADLVDGPIKIYSDGKRLDPAEITAAERIGISAGQDLLLRFFPTGSPWKSK